MPSANTSPTRTPRSTLQSAPRVNGGGPPQRLDTGCLIEQTRFVDEILRKRVVGQNEANDLAQETFAAALKSLKNFRGDAQVSTWLVAILRNQYALFLRGRKKWSHAPIEVAELSSLYTHEEPMLCEELGLGDDVVVNPSGGPLCLNAPMVTGLTRIGEAFRQINEHGKRRTLGHASAGPCLQQNLVCVLEAE